MAERLRAAAELLSALETHLNLMRDSIDPELFRKGISVPGRTGRFIEARGWSSTLRFVEYKQEDPRILMRKYLPLARKSGEQTDNAYAPELWLRGSGSPSRNGPILRGTRLPRDPRSPSPRGTGGVDVRGDRFTSRIDASYYEWTREENGWSTSSIRWGRLGAFDYDLYGRCDLYVAQAHNWRDEAAQPQWIDRLYRNAGDAGARDVTSSAWRTKRHSAMA